MPLPNDEKVVKLAQDLLGMFDGIFGRHPSFRAAHAKGELLSGKFVPSAEAASLSKAPQFNRPETPVFVRFSNSTGVPIIPDNDEKSNPKGIGIRFQFGEHQHTDIVGHSTDGFPTRTGEEFLEFLQALVSSDLSAPSDPSNPKPIEKFLHSHPAALAFVTAPKPFPTSFAREQYFGVSAYQFTNAQGQVKYGRYRVVPESGVEYLDDQAAKEKTSNYLFDEIGKRVATGPISFRVEVQLAEDGDVVDDNTKHWPASRTILNLGTFTLTGIVPNNAKEQQVIIFDPIPRGVDGLEATADPLFELRAAIYLISGKRRRADPAPAAHADAPASASH